MKYKTVFLGLSLLLYGIALALPCLLFNVVPIAPAGITATHVYTMKGAELTALGIFGLLFLQIPAIGWLANPVYWLCCILFMRQQYKFSAIAGFASVVIGFGGTLSAFWFTLPADSGGIAKFVLNKPLFGFWLWLAAPGLLALISMFRLVKKIQCQKTLSEI